VGGISVGTDVGSVLAGGGAEEQAPANAVTMLAKPIT
jgi:hypothetical protein